MSKKLLPVVVIVLLLLLGGWYFMSKKASPGATLITPGSAQPATTMSSLKALIAKGVSQSCTYNSDKSQGTIYMDGGKVRADIDATVGSVTEKVHMIMMNSTSYIWIDGKSTGFKMAFDPNATPVPGASPSSQSGIDPNTAMNYNCSPWLADASKFALPTGVTFATFAAPSGAAPQTQAAPQQGSSSSQCSYCNALSGSDKEQCLTALNCK